MRHACFRAPDSILAAMEEEARLPRERPVGAIVLLQQEKLDELCAAAIGELERHWAFRWDCSPATATSGMLPAMLLLWGR